MAVTVAEIGGSFRNIQAKVNERFFPHKENIKEAGKFYATIGGLGISFLALQGVMVPAIHMGLSHDPHYVENGMRIIGAQTLVTAAIRAAALVEHGYNTSTKGTAINLSLSKAPFLKDHPVFRATLAEGFNGLLNLTTTPAALLGLATAIALGSPEIKVSEGLSSSIVASVFAGIDAARVAQKTGAVKRIKEKIGAISRGIDNRVNDVSFNPPYTRLYPQ